jgi:amino acid adenylation domain-containing protein
VNLADLVQSHGRDDAIALLAPGRRPLAYAQLSELIAETVESLNRLGIGRGDRVGLAIQDGPEMAAAFVGIAAGATVAPLNLKSKPSEAELYLQNLRVMSVVVQAGVESGIRVAARALRIPIVELSPYLEDEAGSFALIARPLKRSAKTGLGADEEQALLLQTSGTTSRPKVVPLTHRNLSCSARNIARSLALTPSDRCLDVMPLFHIHGLVGGLLSSLAAGGSVVCPPGFVAPKFFDWVAELAPTWYSAVPTIHQAILAQVERHPGGLRGHRFRFVRSSSSPLSTPLMRRLEEVMDAPVIQAYGMTEASHQICLNPLPPGTRKPNSVGLPTGTEVAIFSDDGAQVKAADVEGEIAIRGENVTSGYEIGGASTKPSDGWLRTGDRGHIDEDGYVFITGRIKEMINRAGEKISPYEVEEILIQAPGVDEAVAFPVPHATLGEEVGAAIVPKAGVDLARETILRFLETRLADHKVPRGLLIVSALPKGPTGKLQRSFIAAQLLGAEPAPSPAAAPGNVGLLQRVFHQVLANDVGDDTDFIQAGGDSILAAQVATLVHSATGYALSTRTIFENPTVRRLSAVLDSIAERPTASPIPRRRSARSRLSLAQERLWFIEQLDPGRPTYHVALALRMKGKVDTSALEIALAQIVARHDSLRSCINSVDGLGYANVERSSPSPVLQVLPAKGDLAAQLEELAVQPFDLAKGPLYRFALVVLGERESVLSITTHHLISDGWSRRVFLRELSALYTAALTGGRASLPELPIQYTDFAEWQRERLTDAALAEHVAYWKRRLELFPEAIALPHDRPRPTVGRSVGNRSPFEVCGRTKASLFELSRKEGASAFMGLLSAFEILLYRWTGQARLVVGAPIANRDRAELEGQIGFFANMLPIAADLGGDPSFREILRRTRSEALEDYAHAELPFEKLVDAVAPRRDPSRSPLFQVTFAFQRSPEELALTGLECTPEAVHTSTSKFDLSMEIEDSAEGLRGFVEYDTDLVDASTIHRLLADWAVLLVSITEHPDEPISRLESFTKRELHQLDVEWNPPKTRRDQETLVARFRRHAARTPDADAVLCGSERLGYLALDRRAGRIAQGLRRIGVGPNVAVGVYLDRSVNLVASVLAIFEAGGVYLPLDPEQPEQRIGQILRDADPAVVLAETGALPPRVGWKGPVLSVDACADGERTDPALAGAPDGAAYIIYTSGTTGTPKGTINTHRGLSNMLSWQDQVRFLESGDRLLSSSPVGFDASMWNIASALSSGAALVLAPPGLQRDPRHLARLLVEERITSAFMVPAMLRLLLEDGSIERARALRRIDAGGEELSSELRARFIERLPRVELHDDYGPAECTVLATSLLCRDRDATASIGRPIDGARVQLESDGLERGARSLPAEIRIDGECVGRGYLNRGPATARSFGPALARSSRSGRAYATGDLGRHAPDGSIHYLGRSDEQLKIRGQRVETREVESTLSQHPSIADVAVVPRASESGPRLIAYVVTEATRASVHELGAFLRERLPEYMIPSAFVPLSALPRSANGKLDRRALPSHEPTPTVEPSASNPRSHVESALIAIWSEITGTDRPVGVHDNLFEHGGHSLHAMRTMSRIAKLFGVDLPIRSFFANPTVAGLAHEVEARLRTGPALPSSIERRAESASVRLSFAQERLWFLDQLEPGKASYSIPTVLRIRGHLNVEALEKALAEILRRHEALRTTCGVVQGQATQVIRPPSESPLSVIRLGEMAPDAREADARRRIQDDAQRPFDLEVGPLSRFQLIELQKDEHLFFFTLHHLVADGWSTWVLANELSALYAAFSRSERPSLPDLPIQYADFAAWQRNAMTGQVREEQLRYWKHHLSRFPHFLELPSDKPRPAQSSARGSRISFAVPRRLADSLRALSHREGATLFMTLLAAFKAVLLRYSGQERIVIGTPIAGRNRVEIEGLIGLFANTLALGTDLSGAPSFIEAIRRVKETALGGYAHQDLPFEQVVEELKPERSTARTPIFQVMFAFQSGRAGAVSFQLGDLEVSRLSAETESTKFDLVLSVDERGRELDCRMTYSTDLFERARIDRLIRHLIAFLESAVADPNRSIAEIRLLETREEEQIRVEWNEPQVALPEADGVIARFRAHALRNPTRPAVIAEGSAWSYGELATRAAALKQMLASAGAARGSVVAVCMERSKELLAAHLAVMGAGAAYLPLDPTYPPDRIEYMLRDSGASMVLTGRAPISGLEGIARFDVSSHLDPPADPGSLAVARPDDVAYVLYTSGSTGKPKGVAVRHAGLTNFLGSMARVPGYEPSRRLLAVTTTCFDISGLELYLPLWLGGTVELAGSDDAKDGLLLRQRLDSGEVGAMQATPATWQRLRSVEWKNRQAVAVLCGGEALDPELARYLMQLGAPVWNLYGPTETTIWSALAQIGAGLFDPQRGSTSIPVGRPIANTWVYVLDRQLELRASEMLGDVCIGGAGVSAGYLGLPSLTASKMIPNPFGAPGRIYQTGDVGRWRGRGSLEISGRRDHQIKLHGFRIELGEIESALTAEADVQEAAVVTAQGPMGPKLVAFVIPKPSRALHVERLLLALRSKLPVHMIPAQLEVMQQFPRTANGKTDRLALSSYKRPRRTAPAPEIQSDDLERKLAELWAKHFGRERVDLDDGYFDLGGHSLTMIRLRQEIESATGRRIALRALLEHSTVRRLAAYFRAQGITFRAAPPPARAQQEPSLDALLSRATPEERALLERLIQQTAAPVPQAPQATPPTHAPVQIKRVERRDGQQFPATAQQAGMWFLERIRGDSNAYNIPSYFELTDKLPGETVLSAMEMLIQRHAAFHATLGIDDRGGLKQTVHREAPADLSLVDLSALDLVEAQRDALVRMEVQRPFSLERLPLVRWTLFRMGASPDLLVNAQHHTTVDGGCLKILFQEIVASLDSVRRGVPPPFAGSSLDIIDYAVAQDLWLETREAEEQRGFWKRNLTKVAEQPRLELGIDPDGAVKEFATVRRTISQERWKLFLDQARELHVTPFALALSLLAIQLARLGRRQTVCVSLPTANRRWEGSGDVVGMLTQLVALSIEVDETEALAAMASRVTAQVFEAMENQELPFAEVVESLHAMRSDHKNPITGISFQLLTWSELAESDANPASGPGAGPQQHGSPDQDALRIRRRSKGAGLEPAFDLRLRITQSASGSALLIWDCRAPAFPRETVEVLADTFGGLLERFPCTPPTPIERIESAIASVEKAPSSRPPAISQARAEAPALRASALAMRLSSLGVDCDHPVLIVLSGGDEDWIALAAVEGARGIAVPVAHTEPRESVERLIRELGLTVAIGRPEARSIIGSDIVLCSHDQGPAPHPRNTDRGPEPGSELVLSVRGAWTLARVRIAKSTAGLLSEHLAEAVAELACGTQDRAVGLIARTGSPAEIVDARNEVQPADIAGELVLDAALVCASPLDAAAAASQRSTPNPRGERGARWYRTRALGMIRSDGSLILAAARATTVGRTRRLTDPEGRAPSSEIESVLLAAWRSLLENDRIGVSDHFLEWGGTSILAAGLQERIKKQLSVEITLRELLTHATVEELARLIESRGRSVRRFALQRIVRKDGDLFPATAQQSGMWFLERLHGEFNAYNMRAVFDLAGELEANTLRSSMEWLVRQHPAFHTTISLDERGVLRQQVHPSADVSLAVVDLSTVDLPKSAMEALVQAEAQRPFALTRLPLVRWTLFRLAPDRHLLLTSQHHVTLDGACFEQWFNEVFATLHHVRRGLPPPPSKSVFDIVDYACAQNRWLATDEADEQRRFWRRVLGRSLQRSRLELGIEPESAAREFGSVRRTIAAEHWRSIIESARELRATPFALLLTSFAVILGRFGRAFSVSVALPTANRRWEGSSGVLGMLAQLVVLPIDVDEYKTLGHIAREVTGQVFEAMEHQELPFAEVVRKMHAARADDKNPITGISFWLDELETWSGMSDRQDDPAEQARGSGASSAGLDVARRPARVVLEPAFDLRLRVMHRKEGDPAFIHWDFRAPAFPRQAVEQLADAFDLLLGRMREAISVAAGRLSLLPSAVQRSMASREPERSTSLLEHALQHADHTAQTEKGIAHSYGELVERARVLATQLAERGVGPHQPVLVVLEGTFKDWVAIAAIQGLGALPVPLDENGSLKGFEALIRRTEARVAVADRAQEWFGPQITVCRHDAPPTRSSGLSLSRRPGSIVVHHRGTAMLSPAPWDDGAELARKESLGRVVEWIRSSAFGPYATTTRERLAGLLAKGVDAEVVDGRGEPQPPDVPGEIVLDSTVVGTGALDSAAHTALELVPKAVGDGPGGQRVYRTRMLGLHNEAGGFQLAPPREATRVDASPRPSTEAQSAVPVDPRNETETVLVRAFRELLEDEELGVRDDFFEHGGTSILAAGLQERIYKDLRIEVSAQELFTNTTVEALSRLIGGRSQRVAPVVPKRTVFSPVAASAEQRMFDLFLQSDPAVAGIVNFPLAYVFSGTFNPDAFEHALRTLVSRHEALRTTFKGHGAQMVQIIHPSPELRVEWLEVSGGTAGQRLAAATALIQDRAKRGFDIEKGPLVEIYFARIEAEQHAVLWKMHHMTMDGWSLGVLKEDLSRAYEAFLRGVEPDLEPVRLQYADFSEWENASVQAQSEQERMSFWNKTLKDLPRISLPLDRPKPKPGFYRSDAFRMAFDEDDTRAIRDFARGSRASMFVVLIAALQTLLHRIAGVKDVVIGFHEINRPDSEIFRVVGMVSRPLYVRASFGSGTTFQDVIQQVESGMAEGRAARLHFLDAAQILWPGRDYWTDPLCPLGMGYMTERELEKMVLPGVTVQPIHVEAEPLVPDHFGLMFIDSGDRLRVIVNHDAEHLRVESAREFMLMFETLLVALVQRPRAPLAELPMLVAPEAHQGSIWLRAPGLDPP